MDVVRDGPADAKAVLIVSSACHGVEGFCGSGVQVALLRNAEWRAAVKASGVAVLYIHALNPYGFSWWRRTTHENVDLNRNFRTSRSRCRSTRPTTSLPRCCCRTTGRPRRPTKRRSCASARSAARRRFRLLSPAASTRTAGPLLRRPQPDLEQRDAAPRAAGTRHALRAHRLDRPAHRPRPDRPRRTHLRLPRRRTGPGPRARLVGLRRHLDLRRQFRLGAAQRPDVARRRRGMRAGRVHRHRARVRHGTDHGIDPGDARRPVYEIHPEADRASRLAVRRTMRDCFYIDTDAWKQQVLEQAFEAGHQALRGLSS